MFTPRRQRTINAPSAVEGFGYWSGRDVRVEFHPAPADTGIVFVRTDLPQSAAIPAVVRHRVEVPRRTSLECGQASVEMVEHIMAALAGLQVDNCQVRVNSAEMPGCDGSSQLFVDALVQAGAVEQDAPRATLLVRRPVRLGDAESWVEARPNAGRGMSLHFHLDYGSGNPIGRQTFSAQITPQVFRDEMAAARTFLLKTEADWLLAQGLGRRATLDDLLIFDDEGLLGNSLRWRNECARHKALDLLGDLSLAGCDLVGHFVAHRSGHRLNADLVRTLLDEGEMLGTLRRSA